MMGREGDAVRGRGGDREMRKNGEKAESIRIEVRRTRKGGEV